MQMHDNIVAYIRQENILDGEMLTRILSQQTTSGQSLISVLKKSNLVSQEQFSRIVAAANNIEFIDLSPEMVDPMAAHMVTYEMVNRHNMIPVRKEANKLLVAMSEPLNLTVRGQIEVRTGCKVVPLAATPDAIKQAVSHHFDVQNVTRQAIVSMRLKGDKAAEGPSLSELALQSRRVANAPITKLVSSIITGAIDARASDIHIEPQKPDMQVRYRIDGLLRDALNVPSSAQLEAISHIKILADMDISERRLPQDGHIEVRHNERDYDLRVSSLPGIGGEKIVCRILDKSASRWSFDEVVTASADNKKFRKLVKNPYGMILLTGPTGSGKTTTLYSVLQLLNTRERNIITVEDPVEYRLDGITQVQASPVIGRTFASALRSILRQDPDIILIGEIRDYETAEIAVSAALTGHLVLSTMHTNDAAGAISRLINLGVPSFLVASSLLGTVAQRLVRRICPNCKESYSASPDELEQVLEPSEKPIRKRLYRGLGCNSCHHLGYYGRKAIYELLPVSQQIRKMVVNGASDDAVKQQAIAEGMHTLRRSGLEDVLNGVTSLEELVRLVDMRTE